MGNEQQRQQQQVYDEEEEYDEEDPEYEEDQKMQEELNRQIQKDMEAFKASFKAMNTTDKPPQDTIFKPTPEAATAATPSAAMTKITAEQERLLKREAGTTSVNVNNPTTRQIVYTSQHANGTVSVFQKFPEHEQYKLNTKDHLAKSVFKDGKLVLGEDEEAMESLMSFIQNVYSKNQTELFNIQSGASQQLLAQQKLLRDNGIHLVDIEGDELSEALQKIHDETHPSDPMDMSFAINRIMALTPQQAVYASYEWSRCFFQDLFSDSTVESCKSNFVHPADEIEEINKIHTQRMQLYEVSLLAASTLGLPAAEAQVMVNRLFKSYLKSRGWPTNKVERILKQFNKQVSQLDGGEYDFKETDQASQLYNNHVEQLTNFIDGKIKDVQLTINRAEKDGNKVDFPDDFIGTMLRVIEKGGDRRRHPTNAQMDVINKLTADELRDIMMKGGMSRAAANQSLLTGMYKFWLQVDQIGGKARVSLSTRYKDAIEQMYTHIGSDAAAVFSFVAGQQEKQQTGNMTDDPMQKKLAEIAKQMEEEKTIERAIEMGGRALDILMKKISESETWKTGIYYAQCAAGAACSIAALYGAVQFGGIPLIIGGVKFVIKSIGQLLGYIAKGIINAGDAAVKGVVKQLMAAKAGVVGFSNRSLAYIATRLHQAGVKIKEGIVTIMTLMQQSTSRKLEDFIQLAIKLGNFSIQERLFRGQGDSQQVLLHRAKAFKALIKVANELGFDEKLLRMYMFEKENIEKEYQKTYGNTGIFRAVGQKIVLSRERTAIQGMMTKFYQKEQDYIAKYQQTLDEQRKLEQKDKIQFLLQSQQKTPRQLLLEKLIKQQQEEFKKYQGKVTKAAQIQQKK